MMHLSDKWRITVLSILCFLFLIVVDMSAIQLLFMKPYQNMLRAINPSKAFTVRLIPAILFYILLTLGFMVFVYPKIWQTRENALLYGFLFGIVVYGFFSLTNYALLEKWDLNITIMDTLWGGIFIAIAAIFMHYLENHL